MIKAITLDFWNTIVDAGIGGVERHAYRTREFHTLFRGYGRVVSEDELAGALRDANQTFDKHWIENHRTPNADELLKVVWRSLGIALDPADHASMVSMFEDSLLVSPPGLADGLEEALAELDPDIKLGIISDTMYSPGRVLRQILDAAGILHRFSAFSFSDETGCSKPATAAFATALEQLGCEASEAIHIGDIARTDIAGAIEIGMGGILYTGIRQESDPAPEPTATMGHWNELGTLLAH